MDYSMFTERGNELVDQIVCEARVQGWDWPKTRARLQNLAQKFPKVAGEAMDTVVRENVYKSLNFKTNFYC